eukprot:COSAG03_NODE_3874_length_1783_cov_1.622328_2_plen_197_part_00
MSLRDSPAAAPLRESERKSETEVERGDRHIHRDREGEGERLPLQSPQSRAGRAGPAGRMPRVGEDGVRVESVTIARGARGQAARRHLRQARGSANCHRVVCGGRTVDLRSECRIDRFLAIFRRRPWHLPARAAPASPRRAGAGLLAVGAVRAGLSNCFHAHFYSGSSSSRYPLAACSPLGRAKRMSRQKAARAPEP